MSFEEAYKNYLIYASRRHKKQSFDTIDQDLIVKINGVKKFFARPGLLKDNVCVKITDVYDEMYDLMRNYE